MRIALLAVAVAAAAAMLGLGGCSGPAVLNSITPDDTYKLASNVVYDSTTGMKLDVYTPLNVAANAPVVVFILGGRWEQGTTYSKEKYRFVGEALAAKGFVAMIPDYRLYPQVKYPAFVDDCAHAVVWAHANARHYGGDAGKLVVLGHSAGAYNAAMLALDPAFMKRAGGERAWLRGMIGLAGPYDFLPITDPDLRDIFGPPENFESTQPILYADGSNPPMLLMAGEDDDVVLVKNTLNLYDRIKHNNGIVDKVIYPHLSHTKIVASLATRLQGEADVMKYVASFVERVSNAQTKPDNYGIQTTVPQ